MNKKLIVLTAFIIAIVFVSGCTGNIDKCGDGVCGTAEKQEGTCSEDCGQQDSNQPAQLNLQYWKDNIDGNPPKAYAYFVLNINDWRHHDQSAYYVSKAIDLFNMQDIGLDLYFTEPVLKAYAKYHSDVIEKIKNSPLVTINYHVRAPHPADDGMLKMADEDGKCKELKDLEYSYLVNKFRDFESHELVIEDWNWGMKNYCPHYDQNKNGGYDYVQSIFSVAPIFSGSQVGGYVRQSLMEVLKEKGLEGYIASHQGGSSKDNPFKESLGLLERPSDFGIQFEKSFKANNPNSASEKFIDKLNEDEFLGYNRPLFANILIHDREFYRYGSWYTDNVWVDGIVGGTLSDKWEKSQEEKDSYWQAYENLVKSIIQNKDVKIITARDVIDMADKYKKSINAD